MRRKTPVRVAIYGAGEHGRVVADLLSAAPGVKVLGFLDDSPGLKGKAVSDLPVLGGADEAAGLRAKKIQIALGLGTAATRLKVARRLLAEGHSLYQLTHPSAVVSPRARLGAGAVVFAGAVVQVDALVGEAAVVNTRAVVEHDGKVGAGSEVAPGAVLCGAASVGEASFIGAGAVVIDHKRVGSNSTIGAGAVVIEDIPDGVVAVGVPARIVKKQ